MSTLDLSYLLGGAERTAIAGSRTAALRLVLLPGEVLRLPRGRACLHVISGTAWVTHAATDSIVFAGRSLTVAPEGDPALFSALGGEPVMVEVV
jgi:hypothetical protein